MNTYYLQNRDKILAQRKETYQKRSWNVSICARIKQRAKERGLDFDLEPEDIVVPDTCPVLGIPIRRKEGAKGSKDNCPSVDRLDPNKGYVKGNIAVISYRANRIKNNATWQELEKIANWLKKYDMLQCE